MLVKTETDDGEKYYYGISDFAVLDDGRLELHWPTSARNAPESEIVSAQLSGVVALGAMNRQGLAEQIGMAREWEDTELHIAPSEDFPRLAEYAESS